MQDEFEINREALIGEICASYDTSLGSFVIKEFRTCAASEFARLEHFTVRNKQQQDRFQYIRREVYRLLCTNDSDYKKERKLLSKTAAPAVSLLTGLLIGSTHSPAALASAMAAVTLLIPLKIGTKIWCTAYAAAPSDISDEELKALDELLPPDKK